MAASEERMRVLQQLESGELSVDQAIDELGSDSATNPIGVPDLALARWRSWWMMPFTAGVILTAFGIWLGQQGDWWWLLAFPSLLLGIPVTFLSLASRRSPWLHVRINKPSAGWPRTFGISLPIPSRLAAGMLRVFGPMFPQLHKTAVDELLLALSSDGTPVHVEVEAGPGEERIEVFIG